MPRLSVPDQVFEQLREAILSGVYGPGVRLAGDWAFMSALVEAAGNLVFQLIMNSVRELYLQRADAFTALVSPRERLSGLYARAAGAVDRQEPDEAARALGELASAQAASMVG